MSVPYMEVPTCFPNQRSNHRKAKSHARQFTGEILFALEIRKPSPSKLLSGKGLSVIGYADADEIFIDLRNGHFYSGILLRVEFARVCQ